MSSLAPLPVATSAPSERMAFLDNARFWVMLLVVIGHSLTELVVMDSAHGVYRWVYLFHMPAFILLTGYTARHYVGDFRQVRRLVSTLVVPYLIVELSLQLITRHYDGEPAELMVLSPQWLGWFMAALVIWRLTTPIWRALRYPITTAIVLSLLSGLIEIPNVLALHKTIAFLPFYVIGLHLDRSMFERLRDWRLRAVAVVVLATSFVWFQTRRHDDLGPWLLWKHSYAELDVSPVEGLLTRTVLIAVGVGMSVLVLSLVPHGRSWTTALGSRTFYCYLLHGYVIILLDRELDLWERIEPGGAWAVVGCIVVAALGATLLMTAPVARLFRPVFEPRLTWMFRDPAESPRVTLPR